MRLPFIASFKTAVLIFWTMLPMMAIFSLPISSCLAMQTSLGELMVEDELTMVRFLRPARSALHAATSFFAVMMMVVYALLVFEWAPQSYLRGKTLLVTVAKEHFYQLEPNKIHTPFAGISCFFKKKLQDPKTKEPLFSNLFLTFNKKNEQLVFTAEYGILSDQKLVLHRGSMHTISKNKQYVATFDQTDVNLQPFLNYEKLHEKLKHVKYATIYQLLRLYHESTEAAFEFHRRISQVLWQLLFPFFALFGIFLLGRKKSNMLLGVVFSGLLYFLSYMCGAIAQGFIQHFALAIMLLYGSVAMLFLFGMFLYKRYG